MEADQEIIKRINQICLAYPKQFSKILHAKNNAKLIDYINGWCESLVFDGILFSTKVYYAINQVTAFPICENCGKQIIKNVYRLFNPRLSFCNAQCKHMHTIRTKGVNRVYEKKCAGGRKRESNAYVIPAADDYEDIIRDIVHAHPYGFMNIFTHPLNSRLREWLDQKFPQLDGYELRTKINWILHDIIDFPVCQQCGKKLEYNINPTKEYPKFCSVGCTCRHNVKSYIVQEKRKNTVFKAYGVDCMLNTDYARQKLDEYRRLHGDEIKKAVEKTKTERYGDPHWNNYDKNKKTKLSRYGNPYWNNRDKAVATYKKHCAEDRLFAEKKVEKRKMTCGKLYGDENYHNEEQGKMTRLVRYGHTSPAHGDNEQKVRRTVRERYGVDYVLQNPEVIRKARSKYFYDGVNFDSSTELYVYMYMKEHAIEFVYKPAIKFQYESCGRIHYYCPDFLFPDTQQFMELKGDHFFNENGIMTCPFRNKNWTDQQYAEKCKLYEAKQQCMLKHNVKIVRYTSFCVQHIMKYIDRVFGKNYVKSFKVIR